MCRSGIFLLTKSRECPFSADLLAFVRIFTAPLSILEGLLQEKKSLGNLRDLQLQPEDSKALEFIEKRYCRITLILVTKILCYRCSLLLTSYPGSISEDEKCLESVSLSHCSKHAILMRTCEKKILTDAINYAKGKREELMKRKSTIIKE